MSITIKSTKNIDGTKQWVYITLTVDGDTCRYITVQPWNTNTPVLSNQDLEDFCNAREDIYNVEILKGMYPGAKYQDSIGDTELEKFTQWITDGHENPDGVVDKVLFKNSWKLIKVNAEKDMKASIFANKTNQQIQNYLIANVTNLTEIQQFLYKLAIEVRNITRRQGWSDN